VTNRLIAIVGSADPKRSNELKLLHTDIVDEAAREIGIALATQGFRILVYSPSPDFIEGRVVEGYASVEEIELGSIQVRSPMDASSIFPAVQSLPDRFDIFVDKSRHWETASIAHSAT